MPTTGREWRFRLLTVFGLGLRRPAPGTWGSVPPVATAAGLVLVGATPATAPLVWFGGLALWLLVFSWACVSQGDHAEARYGRKDPSPVVADEVAGQAVTLLLLPTGLVSGGAGPALFTLVLAFLAFRLADIAKPWPANAVQRAPSGWGILLDDLIAGVYAAAVVHAAVWLSR